MNARQFFEKVAQLRKYQKEYFATRTKESLHQSIQLEKEIDAEIARVLALLAKREDVVQQSNLFSNE